MLNAGLGAGELRAMSLDGRKTVTLAQRGLRLMVQGLAVQALSMETRSIGSGKDELSLCGEVFGKVSKRGGSDWCDCYRANST